MDRALREGAAAGTAAAGVAGALAAAVASACCVGPAVAPLVVALLGAGGAAWAASLEPYSPYILGLSGLLLAYALWSVHGRAAGDACDVGEERSGRWRRRLLLGVVWGATLLWLVSLGVNVAFAGR